MLLFLPAKSDQMRNSVDRKISLLDRLIGSDKVVSVVFIRHCETALNAQRLIDGDSASSLTARGRSQARALRTYLNIVNQGWLDQSRTKWLVSPMVRAEETAAALVAGSRHEIENDFREVDVGHVQGKSWVDAVEAKILSGEHDVYTAFPGGESFREAQTRSMAALSRHMIGKPNDLVIVAHGGIIVLLILGILEISLDQFPFSEIDNGSCSIVEFHNMKGKMVPKIRLLNYAPSVDG
jgi:broad specificity phosphatase PhoE